MFFLQNHIWFDKLTILSMVEGLVCYLGFWALVFVCHLSPPWRDVV